MNIPREQFDELLGGKEQLPQVVSFIRYADARCQEISALTEAIEDPQNNHLAFQKMPKHLRRRTMSHNVKRMPRRLQEVHLSQLEKSGLPVKGKRPTRKFRRRPCNLLLEYNRRQRSGVWLETHIWHAKRFHMTELWGYKLPDFANDKSFRACYRATAKHCLIQDFSYLNCIELHGSESDIITPLNQLASSECGLTFAAKATINGNREGSVIAFRRGTYPFQALGKVSFTWRPEVINGKRKMWIWCHPAFYNDFLQELISVFQFKSEESSEMDVDQNLNDVKVKNKTKKEKKNHKENKDVERIKLATKKVGRLPKFSNGDVEMFLLKDTLNRFRLTGPLAQVVLTEALKFVDQETYIKTNPSEQMEMDIDISNRPRSEWLMNFYKEDLHSQCLKHQKLFWKNILPEVNSADELPPRMIVTAVIMDPRLSMPSSRIKAINSGVSALQADIPEGLSACNPLWETGVRDTVTCSKMAAAQLNSLRTRALVPGLAPPQWLGHENVSHLPVMLVQNPGMRAARQQSGYGSGWDIIVPASWGMPVWMGLVFRGARPGGLRETEKLTLETASGPTLPPDTAAAQHYSEQCRKQLEEKHFRLPPDKRPNYTKLGIVTPFNCPWEKLLQDWVPGGENLGYYVIRNRIQLDFLQSLMSKVPPFKACSFTDIDKQCGLVQVGLELIGRGNIGKFSLICALGKKDIKLTKVKSGRGPKEPLHEDVNEEPRKTLREAHQAKLKRLRKKRVRAKRKKEDEEGVFPTKEEKKIVSPTEEMVKKQAEEMKELWLPKEIKTVKDSSSRSVMGFVTCGDYSFTRSYSYGYGFVSLSALLSVLQQNQSHVLVRSATSFQYYVARLKLLSPT